MHPTITRCHGLNLVHLVLDGLTFLVRELECCCWRGESMRIARLRHVLIFGMCCSFIWPAPLAARFLQIDPVGYKDQFNLYAYVGNDPVNFIDATGRFRVLVNSQQDRDRILPMVNSLSRQQYEFRGNELRRDLGTEPNQQGSISYSSDLDAMVDSSNVVVMDVGTSVIENGITYNVDTQFNGGVTYLGDASNPVTNVIISGNGSTAVPADSGGTLNQSPAEILMHEVVRHAAPHVRGILPSNQRENQVRDELPRPRRGTDPSHPQ